MIFLSSETFSVILYLVILLTSLLDKNNSLNDHFLLRYYPLLLIILVLSVNLVLVLHGKIYEITTRDIVKDFWLFSRPLFLLILGHKLGSRIKFRDIYKSIILVAIISATYHFVQIFSFGIINIFEAREEEEIAASSYIEALSLAIMLQHLINKKSLRFIKLGKSNFLNILIFLLILISSFLYFSRSMILVVISILFITNKLYKINYKSILRFSIPILVIIYLYSINPQDNKFLYKIQRSVKEVGFGVSGYFYNNSEKIYLNDVWRGYEAYRAIEQLIENKAVIWFVGEGMGSKVDLGFYQKLGQHEFRYIPKIHNGWALILFKAGILGVLLYLLLFYKMVIKTGVEHDKMNLSEESVLLFAKGIGLAIFTSSFVIGGLYNSGEFGSMVLTYGLIIASIESKLNSK